MIGSHDTFTYLKSTSWIYNNCKKWWKCQKDSIEDQYKFGIRFFDIRVVRDDNKWRAAHGACKLKKTWKTLDELCAYIGVNFPEAIYRIVLESGNRDQFLKEVGYGKPKLETLCGKYPNLWRVDIKDDKVWMGKYGNNNDALFARGYAFAKVNTWEEPAYELHGNISGSNFYKADLRKEAKEINSRLIFFMDRPDAEEHLRYNLEDKTHLYLLDYCTNKY